MSVLNLCPLSVIGGSRCADNQSKWFSIWTKLWCHHQGPGAHQKSLCCLKAFPKNFKIKKLSWELKDLIITASSHTRVISRKLLLLQNVSEEKNGRGLTTYKPYLVVLILWLVGLIVLMSNKKGFQFLPNVGQPSKRQWTSFNGNNAMEGVIFSFLLGGGIFFGQ